MDATQKHGAPAEARESPTRFRNAGPARLSETVSALRLPASYRQPVARVEAIETHMSWVFLTELHAYKLKKPVATPFIDCTTVALRRAACEEELRLNRRLASDVYLAVVPVVQMGDHWRVESEGEVVDWLVKMRRLPRERMLDACIERASVTSDEIERLADTLSAFYARAERTPTTGAEYRERLASDIAAKRSALQEARYGLSRADVDALGSLLDRWIEQYAALLESRAGSVVEAHGDLRPEHVCLEAQPVIIDCLEFARSLRLLDPLSELSFLALEARRLSAAWIGERVIERYMRHSGVFAPSELVAFYQAYHALVRATVTIWHVDDDGLDGTDRFRTRARHYLQLGRELLS